MRVLPGKRYNPAKPLLFGKSGYNLVKGILRGESVFLADELITGLDNEGLEEFIWTLKGEKADKLEYAIRGRGVFRRFKDMADRMGILQQWYDFQAEYDRKLATQWCREQGLEYEEESM